MMRKLAMAMVVSGALGSSFANALGLGEIKMNSGLNQPLDADVKLLNVGNLSVNQILPNLASHKDFSRAGVERIFFLTGIKFEVEIDGKGGAVLHLTTNRIVREPYLNFLIEVHWPSGRLLREYTALLDPPLFSQTPPAAVTQASAAQPVIKSQSKSSVTYNAPTYNTPAPARSDANAPVQNNGTVNVKKNDTLWSIARENRPDRSVTVRQTMLAIQQHNSDAFINDNINLLKSGQVLRVPDVEEIRRVSSSKAYTETSRQNAEWASKKTIDATQKYNSAPADSSIANVEQSGRVKLVAEDDTSADQQAAASASEGSDDGDTGVTDGEQSGDGSANNTTNVDNLEKELQDLQRLVTLKQEQLALLQLSKAEDEESITSEATIDSEKQTEAELATGDAQGSDGQQALLVDDELTSEIDTNTLNNDNEIAVASDTPTAQAETETNADQSAEIDDTSKAEDEATKVAEIEAVAVQEDRPEESVLDILTNNPLYIGVMIVVILGALILLGSISRRRNEEKEYSQELNEDINISENDTQLLDDSDFVDVEEVNQVAPSAAVADAEPLANVDDTRKLLEEADIYIAYGRYERAAEIVQPAVNDAPENTALRLKLAEIFLASNELAKFTQQEADLQAIGDAYAIAKLDTLKAKYATTLAAESELQQHQVLADKTPIIEEAATPVDNITEPDDNADLDELEFDLPNFDTPVTLDTEPEEELDAANDTDSNLVEFTTDGDDADDGFNIDLNQAKDADSADFEDNSMLEFSLDDELELDEEQELPDSADDADDMDFLVDTDESATKLELAKAYIDMADAEAAREILNEVVSDGNEQQQNEAKKLLENLM